MTTAERFYSELDALKLKTREIPHTLTAEEVRACEAVKLQMKGELSAVGKVSVEEVEKIDEAVKAIKSENAIELTKRAKVVKGLERTDGVAEKTILRTSKTYELPEPVEKRTGEIIPKYADILDYEFNAVSNPGPLALLDNNPAANFFGGRYNIEILSADRIYYRAGSKENPLGQWFTRVPSKSKAQVRSELAVKAQWVDLKTGRLEATSTLDVIYAIKIPKGTVMYEGPVGYQGGIYQGGAEIMQTFIPTPWEIPGKEIISETPLQ